MKDEWMIDSDRLGGFGDGQTDRQTNNQLEIDIGSCRVIFETCKSCKLKHWASKLLGGLVGITQC